MKKGSDEENDEQNTDIDDFFEKFQNRKRYSYLNIEILASISDDDIEQAVIDYLRSKFLNNEKEYDIVSSLSPGFQMVYSTWLLESEVDNGGFNQFFFNNSGQYAKMALKSFHLLGANEHFQILNQAISIYEKEKDNAVLQELYAQRTIETFFATYKLTDLNQCDKAFYKLKEDKLRNLRVKFIREHPDQFIGN